MERIQKSIIKIRKLFHHGFLIAWLLCMILLILQEKALAELTITANHDNIKINSFYHGSTLRLSGEANSGTDLIIRITSPDGIQTLRKKGKFAGFLWMNVGKMQIEHAPDVYFIHSAKQLNEILDQDEMDKYVIGYTAIGKHVDITPVENEADRLKWFAEFVKFKEASKLYASSSGKISLKEKDGNQNYNVLIEWPYQAPPGDYLITVYAAKDNKIIDKAETNVKVEQTGVIKILINMANNKAALYGGISILIALGTGFGVGMIFKKGGGSH